MQLSTIRRATNYDASEIARVHMEAFASAYEGILPEHALRLSHDARCAKWREIVEAQFASEVVLVAERSREIVGFIHVGPEREHDPDFGGEIYAIYLLSASRGQGIGTLLLGDGMAVLRAARWRGVKVWTLRDNPYRRFYEKHGGLLVGEATTAIGGTSLVKVAYGWTFAPERDAGRNQGMTT